MPTKAQVDRIRELSRQGKSANQIDRTLRSEHMGMRRTTLLNYVREFKGRPPPRHPERHIPHRAIAARKMRKKIRLRVKEMRKEKKIAIYGTVDGEGRRFQFLGKGKDLYKSVMLAVRHPPKKEKPFTTVDAEKFLEDYGRYLSREKWDERPAVKS